jgi:GT2 family glycosyltransferase
MSPLVRLAERASRRHPLLARGVAGTPARAVLNRAIRQSGLFDAYAYGESTTLWDHSEKALIDHYLKTPPGLGPSPQPRFDAERYRALTGLASDADAFLDFVVRRRDDGLSGEFAVGAYLRDNPDIRVRGLDAARHYLERGWREGRLAGAYAETGPAPDFSGLTGRAEASPGSDWIDVIVPAYGGRVDTLACLHSVLAAKTEVDFRLVVIDDASPEPELSNDLATLTARGLIHGLSNPRNLGFTATANRGLSLSPGRDVVLLNSDTEVYDGWLDRLRAHAQGAGNIGTVTPLSNAATILSYPAPLRDNPAPLELSYGELAGLAGGLAMPPVEIPTAIGFCMYIRRACLDDVGLFDVEAFPTGYGEENDFCLRATARGWRHLAATEIFVKHIGSKSFGVARRTALVAAGLAVLARRYPFYQRLIDRFIARDPLSAARRQLDIARIRRAGGPLRLIHDGPGYPAAPRDILLRKAPGCPDRYVLHAPWCPNTPNLPDLRPARDPGGAAELLRELTVGEIVVRNCGLIGPAQANALRKVAAAADILFRAG